MSTGAIVAIVVVVIVGIALVAVVGSRLRARAGARRLEEQRDRVADAHRQEADTRMARAELAEHEAHRERAEAELHEARAKLHERGLADDQLDRDADQLEGREGRRFQRERVEDDVPAEERPPTR
jgi:hypothetical protein